MVVLIVFVMLGQARGQEIIKIGLLDDVQESVIGAEDGLRVLEDNGESISLTEKDVYQFEKKGDNIGFADNQLTSESLIIYPQDFNSLISVNGLEYKGYIEILNRPQGLTVINYVDFKNYLSSVVGSEVSSSWPMETLKAQVVVARTYALRNLESHLSRGYNLSATVRSQAYKGVGVSNERTQRAVKETEGEVVVYNGNLISAVYHSTAGGQTAAGATVWGSETPYLQSVSSNDTESPHYSWEKVYSREEIENILRSRGISIKNLDRIKLEDKGPSSRPRSISVYDLDGSRYSINSNQFRSWLDLRSTRFAIKRDNSLRFKIPLNRFSFDLNNLGKSRSFNLTDKDGAYRFVGNGWGHGVGMSQWGAYQMAKEGYSYDQILAHYYQGTEIGTR